ncbi:tRNA pseudouridine(55) synthase TruB [Candidatus Methylopumilus universalis]|jgi:tRNA pseudouridine55 synthase|uniref:tRNA pseudouridine synthase B n=1 Tax=Candidatus Methylopumilus universalis TaxID=2588536 RepID=A0AAX1EXI8_9PROT|nr:tRNA pseudouridine(55) synthase TruB [Candidatus Methylopumilus universalis]QDC40543.1 tRNA pseudouridine(55) synthase TruB [Candidatus Methylopumilus universalis]QDC41832.1 tRNA pseudouridine(55) synthase TruB [Candidatus Methylopumilus universalis]QDC54219.1 tRNA pseudouridine(55) synthase TruB [Candidatus Methylopumilus universalis]QDC55501.1 tRNA pseudouridine(55) synthase TruB [Candidatus Methylopumilus universalis]QDC56782.1 tRNA pseudouridine(55) synthase TruB [Candidatus Methylopumi
MQKKSTKREIDGVFLLNKPLGFSSNQALKKIQWLLNAKKAGHTGTLDPMASGLLPICLGEATKFSNRLLNANKTYIATVQLGVTTTTGDQEGEVISEKEAVFNEAQVKETLQKFVGDITQIPPMYSALKFEGRPLYEYARQGIEIERKSRQITIYDIGLMEFQGSVMTIEVSCSKGTYIRTLAEDIGHALGCGAHLKGLERTQTGNFQLSEALTIEALEDMDSISREKVLLPIDALLEGLPSIELTSAETELIKKGQSIDFISKNEEELRLYSVSGQFVGVGQPDLQGRLFPKRLIANIL